MAPSVCISPITWESNPSTFLALSFSSELVIAAEMPGSELGSLSQAFCSLQKLKFLMQCYQSIGIKLVLFLTSCFSGIFVNFCRITEDCPPVLVVLLLDFCLFYQVVANFGSSSWWQIILHYGGKAKCLHKDFYCMIIPEAIYVSVQFSVTPFSFSVQFLDYFLDSQGHGTDLQLLFEPTFILKEIYSFHIPPT